MSSRSPTQSLRRTSTAQRGTVLLFTLLSLLVMLIASVALIRSFNNSLFNAGNLAFKRDLQNQADRITPQVLDLFNTGVLANKTSRGNHAKDRNYSASLLPSNAQGIPEALLSDTAFNALATPGNDVEVTLNGARQQVNIRYLIDRQCRSVGDETLLGAENCVVSVDSGASLGGSGSETGRAEFGAAGAASAAAAAGATAPSDAAGQAGAGAVPAQVAYRISILITGPRKTQAFYQTTFTR